MSADDEVKISRDLTGCGFREGAIAFESWEEQGHGGDRWMEEGLEEVEGFESLEHLIGVEVTATPCGYLEERGIGVPPFDLVFGAKLSQLSIVGASWLRFGFGGLFDLRSRGRICLSRTLVQGRCLGWVNASGRVNSRRG
jgi:hypothetical protein